LTGSSRSRLRRSDADLRGGHRSREEQLHSPPALRLERCYPGQQLPAPQREPALRRKRRVVKSPEIAVMPRPGRTRRWDARVQASQETRRKTALVARPAAWSKAWTASCMSASKAFEKQRGGSKRPPLPPCPHSVQSVSGGELLCRCPSRASATGAARRGDATPLITPRLSCSASIFPTIASAFTPILTPLHASGLGFCIGCHQHRRDRCQGSRTWTEPYAGKSWAILLRFGYPRDRLTTRSAHFGSIQIKRTQYPQSCLVGGR
jgi:hypothetical protein